MSKSLRYYGEIAALGGHTVRAEIWKEGDAPFLDELTFPADSPIVIDWADADKIEPTLSSACTLKIESMSDRQFLDELYTEASADVRLDIYRDGVLYWSGTLDPEQYEEPYSYGRNYDVTISFQDFAHLDRVKYSRMDNVKVKDLVEWIIGQAGFSYGSVIWKTSTKSNDGTDTAFTSSYVKSANWYDEEGEAMSLREVLDETLRAFSLRLKQKAGNVYVYDLNAVYNETPTQIEWDGEDATVSADRIYNNIEVTWSPYDDATIFESDIDIANGATAESTIQFPQNDTFTDDGNDIIFSLPNQSTQGQTRKDWWNKTFTLDGQQKYILKNREGFILETFGSGKGVTLGGSAKFFKVSPQYSGQDDVGVLLFINRFDIVTIKTQWMNGLSAGMFGAVYPYTATGHDALTFAKFYIPTIQDKSAYYLKLEVETLIDTRINPYESNSKKQNDRINVADHIYIPYNLKLESDDGNTYYWDTTGIMSSTDTEVSVLSSSSAWKQSGQQGHMFSSGYSAALHYTSNISAPTDADANLGWSSNTVMMPRHSSEVSDSVQSMGRGEFIPLPTTGGWVTLTISDIIDSSDTRGNWEHYINGYLGWLAFKSVKVKLVDKYGNDIKTSDIVTTATINKNAKEELTVDTLLDASTSVTNLAKGMLVDADGSPLQGYRRGGDSGSLAKLICNTIFSQYGTRKLAISGTASLIGSPCILSEQNTAGKFILTSESQDLRTNTSEVRMVQFLPDSYTPTDNENITTYSITKFLAGTLLGNPSGSVNSGEAYTTTVVAPFGFTLNSVEVTMGGTDITSSAYSNGVITIPSVSGDIVITAISDSVIGDTAGLFTPSDYDDGLETADDCVFYSIINNNG